MVIEKALVLSGGGGAIVEVHAVHEHGDVHHEYERHQPREPWFRWRTIRWRRWRWFWLALLTTLLNVRLRHRPLPHCDSATRKSCNVSGADRQALIMDAERSDQIREGKERQREENRLWRFGWQGESFAGQAVRLGIVFPLLQLVYVIRCWPFLPLFYIL